MGIIVYYYWPYKPLFINSVEGILLLNLAEINIVVYVCIYVYIGCNGGIEIQNLYTHNGNTILDTTGK